MIPDKQAVLTFATDNSVSMSIAAERLLRRANVTELRKYVAEKLASDALREARRLATDDLPDMNPDQLALFELHTSLPAYVRTVVASEEVFLHWPNATLDEHAESVRYRRQHHIQQAGIAERLEQRIYQVDEPRDVAVGYLAFKDVRCAFDGDPWLQNDPRGPFELAHDQPVAGRSGDTTVRWAHRECNRKEGV